jgi:hypothetical protein
MATSATPYGLIPVKKLGGQPYNNSFSTYPISDTYSTSIFKGDVVKFALGYINKDTGTTSATPCGVFLGCQYVDPTYGLTFRNMWTASTANVAGTAFAFVCDDPDVVFKIQGDGAGAIFDYENVGANTALVQTVTGNSTTGVSGVQADSSAATSTNTLPIKIVGWDHSGANVITDTYLDMLVIFNTHAWRTATAQATS